MKSKPPSGKDWDFVHNLASQAKRTPGLREIFEYRDLGVKRGTKGDYVAHLIRGNGKKVKVRHKSRLCLTFLIPATAIFRSLPPFAKRRHW